MKPSYSENTRDTTTKIRTVTKKLKYTSTTIEYLQVTTTPLSCLCKGVRQTKDGLGVLDSQHTFFFEKLITNTHKVDLS
jgi:hypothetical protein